MTKILKMEMKGFKSFAQKTEIPFEDNFNCILGPNGSGKSNVLDALCFVLGKSGAKSLRAEKTANLIYNGGKSKKPASHGEVSLYLDNSSQVFGDEFDVLKLTRIIKKSGQSDYKINDETRTRTQILDLLSKAKINPDGYNIILQGDIVRIVEMSPNERRQIIEEISGINIYEEKKQKALRELDRVEEKINEAQIILSERETYLKELKSDRDKAQRFKDLDEKVKRNKATIIHRDLKEKNSELQKLDAKKSVIEQKISQHETKTSELREKISGLKSDIDKINKEVEEKGEKEQVEIHKQVEQLKVDVALNNQRMETLKSELDKIKNRKKELQSSLEEVDSKSKILIDRKKEIEKRQQNKQAELEKVEKNIEGFRKKNKLDNASEVDKEIEEVDKEIESEQQIITSLREKQQSYLREKDRYETKLQGIDEKIEKLLGLEEENKKELEKLKNFKQEFKTTTTQLSQALSQDSTLSSEQSTAHTKLLSKKEQLSKLRAKSASIREQISGGQAINEVLNMNLKGVYGCISDLGNVDSQHSLALEVAAGGRIRSIVVETDEIAAKCINHLKTKRSGIASFIPLNKIRSVEINQSLRNMKKPGVIGLALDLVNFDHKYKKAFEYVFGNTLVVKDIETARKIGVGTVRMVTLSGDIVETSGAMQGGHRRRSKGVGFAEKDVQEDIERLEKEVLKLETVVQEVSQKRRENEEVISRLRELKANLEGDIIKLEKTLRVDSDDLGSDKNEKKRLAEEIKELEEKIDDISMNITAKNRSLASLKTKKQELREQISNLRNPALLAELTSYDQKKTELKEELGELAIESRKIDAEMESIYGPEKENIAKIFKQLEKEQEDFLKEHTQLKEKTQKQEKELKEKEKSEKEFYQKFKDLFNKRTKLNDEANKHENQIIEINSKIRESEQKLNVNNMELAKIKAQISGLEEEQKHFEGVKIYDSKSTADINKEIREFERMMENFGAVNMRALEIYEKVEEEYNKLKAKKESLIQEQKDVLVMINEVDNKKKVLFMKTFDVVSHNFKEIFSMLSTKGQAYIELEDKNDPFNGGLNIKVRLSGTKYMDIRSLSGGEKTMTALAFIFAVQEHEPAAFYVLDEVDAALDKKNSERLAKLVQQYSKRAQYIIISHNDGVIQEADNLYGISMNEHGMSKVTSLKI